MSSQMPNEQMTTSAVKEYECEVCQDTTLIIEKDENGYDVATFCACKEKKAWQKRFKNAMIPEEFVKCNFSNFEQESDMQKAMYQMTLEYLEAFKSGVKRNFGFYAVIGDQRLKKMDEEERYAAKTEVNNFGIGKTHLHIALAKQLIKEGYRVLSISDAAFMEELMMAKRMNDEGETANKLMRNVKDADLVIWDDIGKGKWTESRESAYFQIIDYRDKANKPIVFSTNEDKGTLTDRIGSAASSRLFGKCGDFQLAATGKDIRLLGRN